MYSNPFPRSTRGSYAIVIIIGAAAILAVLLLRSPALFYYWSYGGFKRLFYQDAGWSEAWASIGAVVCALAQAVLIPATLGWFALSWRHPLAPRSLLRAALMLGALLIAPVSHALWQSNFDQASGKARRWYVHLADGRFLQFDSGGFDPRTGLKKRRLTPEIAEIIQNQKVDRRPNLITTDPQKLSFFDPIDGRPRVWYHIGHNGRFELFDADGFYPGTDERLRAVTPDVAAIIKAQAQDGERRSQLARIAKIFNVQNYPYGITLVGVRAARDGNKIDSAAAEQFMSGLMMQLRQNSASPARLHSTAYQQEYFDQLMEGNYSFLRQTGLLKKMKMGLFAILRADCRPAESVEGIVSCAVEAKLQIVKAPWIGSQFVEWSDTGAGSAARDAIARADDLLLKHSPPVVRETIQ